MWNRDEAILLNRDPFKPLNRSVAPNWIEQFMVKSFDRFEAIRAKVFVMFIFIIAAFGGPGFFHYGVLGRFFYSIHCLMAFGLFFLWQKPSAVRSLMFWIAVFILFEFSLLIARERELIANIFFWAPTLVATFTAFLGVKRALPFCLAMVGELSFYAVWSRYGSHPSFVSYLNHQRILVVIFEIAVAQIVLSIIILMFEQAKVRAEDDLKIEYEKRLEARRMTFVRELIGNVAHEINNPLAIIQACVLRLERSQLLQGTPEYIELINNIEDAIHRVCSVRDGLGHFAVGNKKEKLEAVDVRSLFSLVLQRQQSALTASVSRLFFSDRSDGLRILCRARQIGSALAALIDNAFEAIQSFDNGRVSVEAFLDQQSLCLRVTDNGSGIPDELHDKIFLPFFTGHPDSGSKGLGLSMSLGTVAEHGGQLDCESRVGQTSFTIRLPLNLSQPDLYYRERRFS